MSDWTWADFQRQEDGAPPLGLSFTADELDEAYPGGMDEDDIETVNHAMARDMAEREQYWMDRALAAEDQLRQLEENRVRPDGPETARGGLIGQGEY